jgi:hypothetical protein
VWRSSRPQYAAYNGTYRDLKKRVNPFVRAGGRFVIVGDSIARQFAKTLECTLAHKLGLGDDAERAVVFCWSNGLQLDEARRCINSARVEDVIVINFGLHVHPQKHSSSERLLLALLLGQDVSIRRSIVPPSGYCWRCS